MSDPRQVSPPRETDAPPAHDPLRLCVMTTVALLAWVLGPVAVLVFAAVGAAGYVRARRAGLLRSRCKLGDTRIVIAYLVAVALVAAAGTAYALTGGHLGV
jgi:hypothetical protein